MVVVEGAPCSPAVLTPRERDVVALLARGLGNDQIASALALSPRTVRNYVSRVYLKIGAQNRVQAVVWWLTTTVEPPHAGPGRPPDGT